SAPEGDEYPPIAARVVVERKECRKTTDDAAPIGRCRGFEPRCRSVRRRAKRRPEQVPLVEEVMADHGRAETGSRRHGPHGKRLDAPCGHDLRRHLSYEEAAGVVIDI